MSKGQEREPKQPENLEHFTLRAKRVLRRAKQMASSGKSKKINPSHIFLALLPEDAGFSSDSLRKLGFENKPVSMDEGILDQVELHDADFSGAAKKILILSAENARSLKQHYIGSEQLLIGVAEYTRESTDRYIRSIRKPKTRQ